MVALPVRIASMVPFPVKLRLYLHLLLDVLSLVHVLAVEVLHVYDFGLHRNESRLVPVVLVVPALRVAVPWSLLLVLGVAVPSCLFLGVAWSVRVERSEQCIVAKGARPRPRLQGVAVVALLVVRKRLPVWGGSPRGIQTLALVP